LNKPDLTRTILETTIAKALKDMETDPERSIRNLVEHGQNFSSGGFQKNLFEMTQTMLKDEKSAYYKLVKNVVSNVDHETLKTFGINLGYNGCTNGARLIRKNESKYKFNIPWTIAFKMDEDMGGVPVADIAATVSEGRKLGVYTYIVSCEGSTVDEAMALSQLFPDCAFVFFVFPDMLEDETLGLLKEYHNVMTSISADTRDFMDTANALRKNKILYAVHLRYKDETLDRILSDEWLKAIAPSCCTFAFLVPHETCGAGTVERVYNYVNKTREKQQYPLIAMDIYSDILYIDRIISEGACSLSFDTDGQVITMDGRLDGSGFNLRQTALRNILRQIEAIKEKQPNACRFRL
jgi:hypothetical protein